MKRIHISWHAEYDKAASEKASKTEGVFQVRRKRNNFELVQRIPGASEKPGTGKTRRKPRRSRRNNQGYDYPIMEQDTTGTV